jgi:hypothetical protein
VTTQNPNAIPQSNQLEEDEVPQGVWRWLVPSDAQRLSGLLAGWRKEKFKTAPPLTVEDFTIMLDAIRSLVDGQIAHGTKVPRGELLAAFAEACRAHATFTLLDPEVQAALVKRRDEQKQVGLTGHEHIWAPPEEPTP